jgi:hypothetical protein
MQIVCPVLLWSVTAAAQGKASESAEPVFQLGAEALAAPKAVLDPFGSARVEGATAGGQKHVLEFRFPEFEPPAAGERMLGKDGFRAQVDGVPVSGTLTVRAFSTGRIALRGELDAGSGPAQAVVLDVPAVAAPAEIVGVRPVPASPPPDDQPDHEDLVFCALGNTGTGDVVQRQIGAAIAKLAVTGPLDFVLLLGDNFLPCGVQTASDRAWRDCFETPYPDLELPMMFHAVLGDRDHLGKIAAQADYGKTNARWHLPGFAYSFTATVRGTEVLFVGFDANKYSGDVGDPAMRHVSRALLTTLRDAKAAWKIVFGHTTMHGGGVMGRDTAAAAALRERTATPFREYGVDAYICAGDHHLELLAPEGRPLEIVSGTGGGLARSAKWSPDTLFASTVPGFAWFRFDGTRLEVSFRDTNGTALHVHRLAKRR